MMMTKEKSTFENTDDGPMLMNQLPQSSVQKGRSNDELFRLGSWASSCLTRETRSRTGLFLAIEKKRSYKRSQNEQDYSLGSRARPTPKRRKTRRCSN